MFPELNCRRFAVEKPNRYSPMRDAQTDRVRYRQRR
jgi:hypothetical protein